MPPEPFDITDCTANNLRTINRLVTSIYDNTLKPTGLRSTQFTLLSVLQKCGKLPLTQLAEVLVTERTTLTRNLKPLAQKNYIATESLDDQRVRLISLTKEGEAAVKSAMPYWQEAQEKSIELLGRKRWEVLIGDLQFAADKLRTNN